MLLFHSRLYDVFVQTLLSFLKPEKQVISVSLLVGQNIWMKELKG